VLKTAEFMKPAILAGVQLTGYPSKALIYKQ